MALTVPVAEIVENSKNPLLGKHESWARVLLGEIATIQNGFPFPSSQFSKDKGMPLIRIRDVGSDNSDTNYVGEYDPAYVVEAGDLLIGMDGDFNCARWRGPKGLLNQRVCRVILKTDTYHPKLLDYALPGYLKAINDLTSSVTVKHLSSKSIAEIPLPLPPMDQQKHIVAEIEKQFSGLDEAVANLKRVKANLKRYKAAVLKAAVEGRLVETEAEIARREGHSFETGEQLLQRILETRRSQWKGKGKYKEPAAPDTTDLPELPEGWVWAVSDVIFDFVTSGSRGWAQYYSDSGSIFIRVGNLDHGTIDLDLSEIQHVLPPASPEADRSRVRSGDLLISITAELGMVAVVPANLGDAYINQHVAIARSTDFVDKSYIGWYFACEHAGKKQLESLRRGATKAGLGLDDIRSVYIALPPLSEQQRVVAEVDRRLSLLRETESQVVSNIVRADRLRQSILSKAFSGLLVLQVAEREMSAAG